MNFVLFGVILTVWVGLLGVLFINKTRLSWKNTELIHHLFPVGVTVVVWMFIFAVVVFGN